ncbi:MAG: hypothetical protein LBJ89_02010 [Holosporales bacterium]|jgi:hypothetical protein|nr:hypothetical protein [Holosporales bacterium]
MRALLLITKYNLQRGCKYDAVAFEMEATGQNEVSEQYSVGLLASLIDYGREFYDTVINKREYHLFDPMISDRSCQLRAIWLAEYCRSRSPSSILSDEDALIFGLSRFLIETANFLDNEVTGRVPVSSNVKLWPEAVCKIEGASKRRHFWGVAKSIIQNRILKDLLHIFSTIPSESILTQGLFCAPQDQVKHEILYLLEHTSEFCFSEIRVPMLHFFPSLVLVASLVSAHNFPIVVVVREIEPLRGKLFCRRRHVFCFMYDDSLRALTQVPKEKITKDEPIIIFLSHSYAKIAKERAVYDIGGNFLNNLNTLFGVNAKLFDYIYAIAATHSGLADSPGGSNKIDGAPVLTELARQYAGFAHQTNLVSSKIICDYQMLSNEQLGQDCLDNTPFRITHVFGGGVQCLESD